jgi:HEAT repeat protein
MDVNRKLVEYHLNRLKDKRSDVRLDAIHELSDLGDPDVLDALREVVEYDGDIQVRKAAQTAAITIYRRQQGSA